MSGPTRTVPSAGGRYPMELYVVAGSVEGIDAGIYSYSPRSHALEALRNGDFRDDIARATVMQLFVRKAPAIIVIGAIYRRTTNV